MNIIGHQKIITYFETVLAQDKLTHAYLFVGPKHVGKTTVAKWLIENISGKSPEDEHFWTRPNPDMTWIVKQEDKKEIPIEKIKDLRSFIHQKPLVYNTKFVVIEGAEDLSIPATNALLKLLEEPSGHTIILLISHDQQNMLPTIHSRCQLIRFTRVPDKQIAETLKGHSKEKTIEITELSHGLPGRARSLADNESTYSALHEHVQKFCSLITQSIATQHTYISDQLGNEGIVTQAAHAQALIKTWRAVLRDMLLLKMDISDKIIYKTSKSLLKKTAKDLSAPQIINALRTLEKTQDRIKKNANPRLALEYLLLELS